jgi:hypothetical protein
MIRVKPKLTTDMNGVVHFGYENFDGGIFSKADLGWSRHTNLRGEH